MIYIEGGPPKVHRSIMSPNENKKEDEFEKDGRSQEDSPEELRGRDAARHKGIVEEHGDVKENRRDEQIDDRGNRKVDERIARKIVDPRLGVVRQP